MMPASEGLHVVRRKILMTLVLLSLSVVNVMAWKVTIDSTKTTGSGNYRTIDELLDSLSQNKRVLSASGEDSVMFVGTEQREHLVSKYVASTVQGNLRFIGQITDPDNFHILNHTAGSWYNLLDNVNVTFERFIFTGSAMFTSGNKAKTQHFRNCVIRLFTADAQAFLSLGSTGPSHTIFENCLFNNNHFTRGLVDIQVYGATPPTVSFINCTIHLNDNVFSCKADVLQDSISVKNCVFSANNAVFYGTTDFKSKITYSFVPNETYSGTGNVSGSDPRYVVPTGKVNPSDWRPTDSSAAKGLGDATGAPRVDISGKVRADEPGKRDAGCWDILDAVKIVTQPKSDTVGVGDTVLFTVKVSGAPVISYAWYKKGGGATPLSVIDTFRISGTTLQEDSTRYYCVISNSVNSVTSDTVILRVFQKPAITDQPDTTVLYRGDAVAFSVAATGGALEYSWLCNDTVIPGASGATLELSAADSGNVYSCTISNPLGSVTSQKALLRILPPEVRITAHSSDTVVMEGGTLALSVIADGKPPLSYTWNKVGGATGISATASYQKLNIGFADSGVYRCIVSNATTKDSVSIHCGVTEGVEPRIVTQSGPVVTVKTGSPVTLSAAATGAEPLTYTWYRKKTASSDSVWNGSDFTIASAQSSDSGYYYCIVSNDIGDDTTSLISLVVSSSSLFNPLVLGCTFVDPTHVRVNVQHFRDLPAVSGSGPYTDTIGLWYNALTIPAGKFTRTDSNCIKLPLEKMTAGSGDSYDTIVSLPGPSEECGTMNFTLTPLWKDPDTIVSSVATIQNASVYMCDSAILENKLVLVVNYTAISDSISVTVSNLSSINRDSMLSLVIGYVFPGAQPVTMSLSPSGLPAGDLVSKVFHDQHFTESEETLTVNVRWRGIGGNFSGPVTRKLVVGKPRPANTATLIVDSTTSTTAGIHWQFSGSADFDSIRIVWSVQPLTPSTIISGPSFQTQMLGNSVRSVIIDKLLPSYTYSIGIQVVKGGVYSLLTSGAIASCTTKTASTEVVVNSIDVLSAEFSPSNNEVALVWTIDPQVSGAVNTLETGIVWSANNPPDIITKIDRNDVTVITDCKDTTRTVVDISKNILFSTPYHFALLLRKKGAASWTSATDSSRVVVTTSAAAWQSVTYFQGEDTVVTAFNNTVILRKVGDGVVSVNDTLNTFPVDSLLSGFIAAAHYGFDFKHDVKSDPIGIGMVYDASLFTGHVITEIHMYQYDTNTKQWMLIDGTSLDTTAKKVSAVLRPNEHPYPFMLLIDTLPPTVGISSDTASPVSAGAEIADTLTISDNIANCTVSLVHWGANGIGGNKVSTVKCSLNVSTVVMTVPADSIVRDRSLKTELVISDGVHSKVFDVSRVVKRQVSDPVALSAMKWTPVMTTSALDVDSVENALAELKSGSIWKYDSLQFRIFRWIDTVANGSGQPGWLEYRPLRSGYFSMVPGRVIWVKTRNNKEIKSLGTGTTVSVREPFSINLKAKEWTDVSLPFKMNIRLGDIFTASEDTPEFRNNILIYKWTTAKDSKRITAQPKYINYVYDYNLMSTVLTSGAESDGIASYSVLNNDTVDLVLNIPPVPEAFSTFDESQAGLGKKTATNEGWSVKLTAHLDDADLTPVLFGSRRGISNRRFPLPPSFEDQRLYLETTEAKTPLGAVLNNDPEAGTVLNAVFENKCKSEARFDCDYSNTHNLPVQWSVALYDPQTGRISTSGSEQVTVASESCRYAVVITGDSAFIASQVTALVPRLSLFSLYPNPCRGDLAVRFNLPPADIGRVRISLFDQLGRCVWNQSVAGSRLRTGYNVFHWNLRGKQGPSAGTYILTLHAYSATGKTMGRKQIQMLYLP